VPDSCRDTESATRSDAWPGMRGPGTVEAMLVSKAAIQKELGGRIAEFAPPGEQLRGLFEAEYGDTPFLNPTGTPIFVLLTTNCVVFVGAKKMSNTPTQTLATIPRTSMRFGPPDNGVAHFWIAAQAQDVQGQVHSLRLKVHKMWRDEATAFVAAMNAPAVQPQQSYPQRQYPQYQQPYPPQPPQSRQHPYPPQQGQVRS